MKVISFFVLVFYVSIISLAQSNDNYHTSALSFSFNGLNLATYYGGVGGRIWVSNSTVLNASIGGAISERNYERTETLDKGLEKNKSLTIGIGIENHFANANDFSPYFSSRLSLGLYDRYYRYSSSRYLQTDKTSSFNLDFGIGVEYWIIDRISVSGQHLFSMRYETGEQAGSAPSEVQDIKGFGIGLGTTSIILSIYF